MKVKKNVVLSVMAVVAIALAVCILLRPGPGALTGSPADADAAGAIEGAVECGDATVDSEADSEDDDADEESAEAEEPLTEEERREAEEEERVDAFDNLTDRWMEPSEKGVTMADVDNFARQFRQVPKARQDECAHRALNLIPDENVMLLAGILMDKSMDKEIVETVFNDILNRDEDVKKPILQQIFKDKTHPCWADTAWILDVTGELPQSK